MRRVAILTLLTGCGEINLSQSWQLDRIRILGVSAIVDQEPDQVLGSRTEARPGETMRFESLYYVPSDESIAGAFWIGCIPESELAAGCEIDPEAFDAFSSLDEDASIEDFQTAFEIAQAAGFIGFEPDIPPQWTVPEDALEGLTEEERKEGTNAFINVSLLNDTEDTDADPAELGFKRFPISLAETPNHNPAIVDFIVADETLNGAVGFTAEQGVTYVIEPIIPNGHIETYRYTTEAGEEVYRSEEPYITWYTELGSTNQDKQATFDQAYSLYPYTTVEWTAPKEPGEIQLYAVIRDRRGGMGWAALKVNVL